MSWILAAALLLPMSACKQGEKCQGVGASCSGGQVCCAPNACSKEGICAPAGDLTGPCQGRGRHCGSSGDCCGVLTCNRGVCDDGISCSGRGQNCGSTSQCCAAYVCRDGYCQ